MRASTRFKKIKYSVMDTIAKAHDAKKSGKEIYYLHIGDPLLFDFKTPPILIESTYNAMKANLTGYTETSGIPEAIDAIETDSKNKGIKNILETYVTTGVSEAIDLCIAALVDNGDNILLPRPSYPLYITSLYKHGAEPLFYDQSEENNWQPDIDQLKSKINHKTKAIVIINPNNPTGAVCNNESIIAILELAQKHNIVVISDEIYDKLILDDIEHYPTASFDTDQTIITFNGLSKSYLVPGFRLGWCIVSGKENDTKELINALGILTRARLCANYAEQFAIKPSLEGDDSHISEMKSKLIKRRDLTYNMINAIDGISCIKPQAAFYAFPRLDEGINDIEFVHKLISETGVVPMHGTAFGQKENSFHFRIVYLDVEERLKIAYKKIEEFMNKYH